MNEIKTMPIRAFTWAGVALLLFAGCGQAKHDRVEVRGRVTADGVPVESGAIVFMPVSPQEGVTAGGVIVSGEYRIPAANGPFPGSYRVQITAVRKTGKKLTDSMRKELTVEEVEQYLPPRYNSLSQLTTELQANSEQRDFELRLGS